MTVELKPETERLVQEEIRRLHLHSVDELIVFAVHALREKSPGPRFDPERRREAVRRMLEFNDRRKDSVGLGEPITRQFLHEGHRI